MKIKEFLSLLNPLKGIIQKNQKIQNTDQLIIFIKERSAWITQVTLLGYLKTRMGTQYVTAFENKELMQSINYGKEKIYLTSIQDLTLYTISYMKVNNLTDLSEQGENIYSKIIDESKNLPLSQNELFKDIEKFEKRLQTVNWIDFYKNNPFDESCKALFKWAPIADDLKQYDEEIVLNSMALKWNNVVSDFKQLINY
jgi:hypothetical protein